MNKPVNDNEGVRRRSRRNWAVFAALVLFIVLVYGVTMVKIAMEHTL
jgi:hypothetical protein